MGCNLDSNLRVSPSTAGSAGPLRPASNDPNTVLKPAKSREIYKTGRMGPVVLAQNRG